MPKWLKKCKSSTTKKDLSNKGSPSQSVKDQLQWKWSNKGILRHIKDCFQRGNHVLNTIDTDIFPHQLFKLFFENELVEYFCNQSKIYAPSKNDFSFHVDIDEMRALTIILLVTGYNSLPRTRMYWE